MSKNIGYDAEFLKDACGVYLKVVNGDKDLYNLVIEHGLFNAMFINNSPEFEAAYKKFGKYIPFFDPKFFENVTIYDKMFNLKKEMTPETFWAVMTGFPEVVKADDAEKGKAFTRVNEKHYFVDAIGGGDMTKCHFSDFKQEGDEYSFECCVGSKPEIPYKIAGWKCELKFRQYKDEGWSLRFIFKDYVQYALAEDMRPVLVQYILDAFDKDILTHFVEA